MQHNPQTMQGLFLLVDRKSDEGMERWVEELKRRNMPALVLVDGHTLHKNPDLIKRIAAKGLDLGGLYNDGALWPETHDDVVAWLPDWLPIDKPHLQSPYEIQLTIMRHINDRLAPIIGKTMPVFSGKYFSYDTNTLKIADQMGIRYILARGTQQARAVFYQPAEFAATIVSVSNVPSKELGTGSLCDESLEARRETPRDFHNLLTAIEVDRVILVAQTHVSGLDPQWWDVYQTFFDSGRVHWHTLEDFVVKPAPQPNAAIPVNKRADYMALNLIKARQAGYMV